MLIKLIWMVDDVSQEHVPKEVPGLLGGVALHKDIKVSESGAAIPDSSVRVTHVERPNELTIIHQIDLLVISLQELRDSASKEVHFPVRERIIANADTTSFL